MTLTALKNMLAVHSVDEYALSVPDLEEARRFYASFGLDVREEHGGLALYTFGHPHRWARIQQGSSKKLLWIRFGIYEKDFEAFGAHLDAQGVVLMTPPSGAPEGGYWFAGPDGLPMQIVVAEKSSPSTPSPREYAPACNNQGRAPSHCQVAQVRPLYLSHILLFTADVLAATVFYHRVLGLKLSDKSAHVIAFMHTPHGSDHHLIALALSGGPGLHHSSWCVPSIDAVGHGMAQMAHAGYARGWGVGRHVLGSNYFRYVRDPWGGYAEYSYDIDFVESGAEWPAADHPGEDSIYVWGPDMPDDFIRNYEITQQ